MTLLSGLHRHQRNKSRPGTALLGIARAGSVLRGSVLRGSVLRGSVLTGVLLAGSVLAGCGAPDEFDRAPSRPMSAITNPEPTAKNARQWRPLWDGTSWIVAWRNGDVPFRKSDLMERLLKRISSFSPQFSSHEARFSLSRDIHLELVPVPAPTNGEHVSGFSIVRFSQNSSWWNGLLALTPAIDGLSSFEALQWNVLSSLPEAAWAEPNLQSELSENTNGYTLPPEMQDSFGMSEKWKRIRLDTAWQQAVDSDGLPRYEFGKRESQNLIWTNVAVMDTGVDTSHPDLWDADPAKSKIFKNPREQLNCKDDDDNGYVDDIHGIDATVEREDWNAMAQESCKKSELPNPGSNEVGGPGVPCSGSMMGIENSSKCGHGTHVAGLIAAKHNEAGTAVGVCPSCRIVPLRVAAREKVQGILVAGRIDDSSQIRAMSYLLRFTTAEGAPYTRIVNVSLGKYFASRSLRFWYNVLFTNNILVVAAAGNDDSDTPNYPAAYEPVLSVCATSEDEPNGRGRYAKTGFSNFGVWVDICAPGFQMNSTVPGGGYDSKNGTSQASPVVAGAAGWVWSNNPMLTAEQVAERLMKHANAPVLYHFQEPNPNIPEGASKTNVRNRLYAGWLADNTSFFQLGTGFLDVAAALTEGRSCWDDTRPANCVSFVHESGLREMQAQVKDGCVISSVAGRATATGGLLASMPFLMVQLYLVHRLIRRLRQKKETP